MNCYRLSVKYTLLATLRKLNCSGSLSRRSHTHPLTHTLVIRSCFAVSAAAAATTTARLLLCSVAGLAAAPSSSSVYF